MRDRVAANAPRHALFGVTKRDRVEFQREPQWRWLGGVTMDLDRKRRDSRWLNGSLSSPQAALGSGSDVPCTSGLPQYVGPAVRGNFNEIYDFPERTLEPTVKAGAPHNS